MTTGSQRSPAPPEESAAWRAWPAFKHMLHLQAAHAGGDALVTVALAGTLFFGVPTGEARTKVGLYLLLTMTPFAVLSPVVGPLIDRRLGAYRLALLLSAVGRAVLALYMATRTDRLVLYPMAFGMLVLSRTHGVSRSALLPETLPPGRSLIAANARMSLVSVLGGTALALPGVGIQKWLGPGATLRVAAATFAFAAFSSLHLPKARRQGPSAPIPIRGKVHTLLSPKLLAAGAATAASRAAIGFAMFLLAFVLREQGEAGAGFGAVLAAAGAGGLISAVVVPPLRRVLRESLLMLGSLAGIAGVSFAVAGSFGLQSAMLIALVAGIGSSAARLAFDSLIQTEAPHEVRGRTFARYETIFQLCWVGGAGLAVAIPFSASVGLRVLGVIALGGIGFALWTAVGRRAPREAALGTADLDY